MTHKERFDKIGIRPPKGQLLLPFVFANGYWRVRQLMSCSQIE